MKIHTITERHRGEMDYNKILLTILIFFVNNILVWYQMNGQLAIEFWRSTRGIITSLLMGIPTAGLLSLK